MFLAAMVMVMEKEEQDEDTQAGRQTEREKEVDITRNPVPAHRSEGGAVGSVDLLALRMSQHRRRGRGKLRQAAYLNSRRHWRKVSVTPWNFWCAGLPLPRLRGLRE